jgi:hypothetical protein
MVSPNYPSPNPHIAIEQHGNAMVVWTQVEGVWSKIWSKQYLIESGEWGPRTLVERNIATDNARNPNIVVDKLGNYTALWVQVDRSVWPFRGQIWVNRYSSVSGAWGNPSLIATSDDVIGYLESSIDQAGNIIAVWNQNDNGQINIWARRYSSKTGEWEDAVMIKTNSMIGAYSPKIAMDDEGNAVVAWEETDSTQSVLYDYDVIWVNRYNVKTGKWILSQMIPNTPGQSADGPEVAMDGQGHASIMYYQHWLAFHVWECQYNLRTDSLGTPRQVIAHESIHHQIAFDWRGNAMAILDNIDSSHTYAEGMLFDMSKGSWAAPESIQGAEIGWGISNIRLAMNKAGNVVAVWTHMNDNSKMNLWANVYE